MANKNTRSPDELRMEAQDMMEEMRHQHSWVYLTQLLPGSNPNAYRQCQTCKLRQGHYLKENPKDGQDGRWCDMKED